MNTEMKPTKKKCYVLIVSEQFPKSHVRAGEPTGFVTKIDTMRKIHTIRNNYELWKKRFEKIENDEAYISIRVWTGLPYKSKQKEVFQLHKLDGIGIEKLTYTQSGFRLTFDSIDCIVKRLINKEKLATNDGLSKKDFTEWFKKVEHGAELAIIHFTNFRYNN